VAGDGADRHRLLSCGIRLERATLGWNAIGIVVLAITALRARSVALAGFGLDSLIEVGASIVVLWELSGTGPQRQRRALRLIGAGFLAIGGYVTVQSAIVLVSGFHPHHSTAGIIWTAGTVLVMLVLARGKALTGAALGNPVLLAEGRVTFIDALLAIAVLVGLTLNAALGAWWADPAAALVVVYYALQEARHIFGDHAQAQQPQGRADG
jgi:divalent metal cation (Fe/Co/Zn/Cd) transporter